MTSLESKMKHLSSIKETTNNQDVLEYLIFSRNTDWDKRIDNDRLPPIVRSVELK